MDPVPISRAAIPSRVLRVQRFVEMTWSIVYPILALYLARWSEASLAVSMKEDSSTSSSLRDGSLEYFTVDRRSRRAISPFLSVAGRA